MFALAGPTVQKEFDRFAKDPVGKRLLAERPRRDLNELLSDRAALATMPKGSFADAYLIYMGAEGTYRTGWQATYADWTAQAEKSTGGKVEGADIRVVVKGDMATAAHYTKGAVKQPDGTMAETAVRETSVFRKEDGQWRMIGHHADGLQFWEKAFDK